MALTAEITQTTWTDSDRVVAATVRHYRLQHEPVEAMGLPEMVTRGRVADVPCVVATQKRIVEIVIDDGRDIAPLVPSAWHLGELGWDCVVLAPLRLMGDGHRLLRGAPVVLQPWWIDDEDVLYGAFERP